MLRYPKNKSQTVYGDDTEVRLVRRKVVVATQ